MTDYDLRYYDTTGALLGDLNAFVRASWSRSVNQVGRLSLTLPPIYPAGWFAPHRRIAVYRTAAGAGGAALDGGCYWLVTHIAETISGDGERLIEVRAVDPLWLLTRRIVDAYAGSAGADKAAVAAGNQIKAFVRECYTAATDTTRNVSSAYMAVEADLGDGASVAKAAAWREVLTVCQEIAAASTLAGTYLAFDLVCADPTGALTFRTFANWRGVDHRYPSGSAGAVLIGPDYGNLVDVTYAQDYEEEVTRGIAGGLGIGTDREVQRSNDTTRQGVSAWGVAEDFTQSNSGTTAPVLDDADTLVREGRPRITLAGTYQDTPGVRWGQRVGYGDAVTAQAFGQSFDCRIDAYGITLADGRESIDVRLRSVL